MVSKYQETGNLIYYQGARNAYATSSSFQTFHTKLLDTEDGLPSLDSFYWKINAYNSEGTPYAPFTQEALVEIERGMKRNRVFS
jgi:hypothetical protein